MISASCSFKEFAEAVTENDLFDILYLAEQEATDAERQLYRGKTAVEDREKCGKQYAVTLKCFLEYMRYGIKSKRVSDNDNALFESIHHQAQKRNAMLLNGYLCRPLT